MRIRDWDDLVTDVVESDVDPEGWRAVAGDRSSGLGEDMYLGHPGAGVYHLKTFAKNPFEVRGVGAHVARRIDEDLDPLFPGDDGGGRFAVNDGPADEDEAEAMSSRVEEVPVSPSTFWRGITTPPGASQRPAWKCMGWLPPVGVPESWT